MTEELTPEMQWEEHMKKRIEENRICQDRLLRELAEAFPVEMERQLTKSGTVLTYIPVSEVITRLNRVLGVNGWSSEVIRCERDDRDPEFVIAHVRLTVSDGVSFLPPVTKDGIGGQKIKRTKAGDIVDLGDEFKGAISDALKKAAQQLGVGLYLARDAEAIEIDEAMHPAPESPADALREQTYDNFKNLVSQLSEDQTKDLKAFWSEWSGGRPTPKKSEFTMQELELLIAESTRLLFSAEYAAVDISSDSK